MTDEVIRVSRMFPMSHIKPFIYAYGAIYMKQVAEQSRLKSLTHIHTHTQCLVSVRLSINLW
ncbi:hypothetical protein EXN66_Car007378 [Channa argus]|uniref:Uncharacterized protein n=1 Tax=Channa argus TaxID=215402 RepID=A0A6G1PNF1_CHAAH|nr:hypothetical protein EXN66_Car007378 [Channa argus]